MTYWGLRVNVPSLPGIKEQEKHVDRKRFFRCRSINIRVNRLQKRGCSVIKYLVVSAKSANSPRFVQLFCRNDKYIISSSRALARAFQQQIVLVAITSVTQESNKKKARREKTTENAETLPMI